MSSLPKQGALRWSLPTCATSWVQSWQFRSDQETYVHGRSAPFTCSVSNAVLSVCLTCAQWVMLIRSVCLTCARWVVWSVLASWTISWTVIFSLAGDVTMFGIVVTVCRFLEHSISIPGTANTVCRLPGYPGNGPLSQHVRRRGRTRKAECVDGLHQGWLLSRQSLWEYVALDRNRLNCFLTLWTPGDG